MTPRTTLAVLLAALGASVVQAQEDIERPPISYSKTKPNTRIERLQAQIDAGNVRLEFHPERGYLASVLAALDVPTSSQVLVFSRTSMQRNRIAPSAPRAIYFDDEIYIGFCRAGQVLEISAVDAQLGGVFYTLEQEEVAKPKFVRQTDSCMLCHASSQTKNIPGHLVRSVFTDRQGDPVLSMGSIRVDQTTPFARRWGGWYVTGNARQTRTPGQLDRQEPRRA